MAFVGVSAFMQKRDNMTCCITGLSCSHLQTGATLKRRSEQHWHDSGWRFTVWELLACTASACPVLPAQTLL